MSFRIADEASAVAIYNMLGEAVTYHQATGIQRSIKAIIDRNVQSFPGGFETDAGERRTEISLLKSDAPRLTRGELIVTDDVDYEIKDIIDDDGIEVRATVK